MTDREKSPYFYFGVIALAFVILYLLLMRPPVVVLPPESIKAATAVVPEPVKQEPVGNISLVPREVKNYSAATIDALNLNSGDLEIGRFNIYIDPETRCQYLRPVYREGLTPRLRKDGKPWCD